MSIEKVYEKIDSMFYEQVQFLSDLVSCKSILCDPDFGEKKVQLEVSRKMQKIGLDIDMFEPDISMLCKHPGFSAVEWGYKERPQVVGVYKSKTGTGKSLSLVGHVDVVPAGSNRFWATDPWKAEIADDRVYGRGAADMKGGVTAMIYAVKALKQCNIELGGDVMLLSVLEEECGGNGALACLERGYVGDGCISPEPMPYIVTACPGVVWVRVKVFGMAAHVAYSYKSANAFDNALIVINALKELEKQLNEKGKRTPELKDHPHPYNFNLGKINGGEWTSSVMDELTFEMRVSWDPEKSLPEGKQMILDKIKETVEQNQSLQGKKPEVSFPALHFDGAVTDANSPLVKILQEAHTQNYGAPAEIGFMAGSADHRFWPLYYGKPGVSYGPAGENIHGFNEYVELDSLCKTTKVLAKFIMDWCK